MRFRSGLSKGGLLLALAGGVVAVGLAADYWSAIPDDITASYVGRGTCVECHQEQIDAWSGSAHDRAMEPATNDTVLASFNDQSLEFEGVTTRVYKDGDRFMANAEGADGQLHDYEVKYTFGYEPLQQYMVELEPSHQANSLGKVQVLRWSWDTQRQKWFYLSPPDVDDRLLPDDPLHWTGFAQNWNHMCADCHSTELRKNFNADQLKYHTKFSEIDVSCEACHGPGSVHVDLANASSLFWDRKRRYGLTAQLKVEDTHPEIHACAPCHARRRRASDEYRPGDNYYDHYSVQLFTPETYYPDGQIRDEVYVYGSFLQSKMYEKDVRCSDCHNPHTTRVKFEDNRLCTSCHQHAAAKYDTPVHHHHQVGSTGASCIECHMPATPYMDIDLRRDHRLGLPRPDLSVRFQTPNACTGCHLEDSPLAKERADELEYYADWLAAAREGDQPIVNELARLDRWAAEKIGEWYGEQERDSAATEAFHLAWQGDPSAASKILAVAADRKRPAIVRASAVNMLPQYRSNKADLVAKRSLSDRDPVVRAAACSYFSEGEVSERLQLLTPLLSDPIRLVRSAAATALASVPEQSLLGSARLALQEALHERRSAFGVDSDLASSHVALALLAEQQQQYLQAVKHYRDAIRVQPRVVGPRSNLAGLLERLNRPDEVQTLREQELPMLLRDAGLAPNNAGLQYRVGLACYLAGRLEEAEVALHRAVQLEPRNADFVLFLALFYEKQQRWDVAVRVAEQLVALQPDNPMFAQTLARFQAHARSNE